MADDQEFRDSLYWAETIVQERQHNTKKKADTTSKLKLALYIFGIVIIIMTMIYIVYRAYNIPDPPSILDEVKNMINQIDASED